MTPAGPSLIQQHAAAETLRAAGWTLSAPAAARLQLLTVAEVGELLRYERKRIERLVASGEIEALRLGSDVRIPIRALEAYLERQPPAAAIRARVPVMEAAA